MPVSRWNIDDYYDPDPHAPDKTYCKRGGFIPDLDFNPLEFGLPPNILEVTDVAQILSLVVAKQALQDAGYDRASAEVRDRTGVILGVGGGQKLITPLTSRLQYPIWEKVLTSSGLSAQDTQAIIDKIKSDRAGKCQITDRAYEISRWGSKFNQNCPRTSPQNPPAHAQYYPA